MREFHNQIVSGIRPRQRGVVLFIGPKGLYQVVDGQENMSGVPHIQNKVDIEQWPDIACRDDKVIGLVSIKKLI